MGFILCASFLWHYADAAESGNFVNRSSEPNNFAVLGEFVYFSADDGLSGRELWRTDGTEEGTTLFFEIVPGPLGGAPGRLAASDKYLFFTALDRRSGGEKLWVTDGSVEGTRKLAHSLFEQSVVRTDIFIYDEVAVMGIEDDIFMRVFRSDGTDAGSFSIESHTDDSNLITRGNLVRHRGNVGMVSQFQPTASLLHLSLGFSVFFRTTTEEASVELIEQTYGEGTFLGAVGDQVLLAMDNPQTGLELYQIDTTGKRAELIEHIRSGPGDGVIRIPGVVLDNAVYFQGDDGEHGGELWRTDGTAQGTYMVLDINPGYASSNLGWLTRAGSQIFFMAEDDTHGREIWVSDGTPEGTQMTRDINRGPRGCEPYKLYAVGDRLYFSALSDPWGEELWCSDGTEAGTYMIKDIAPGEAISEPYHRTAFGDRLVFSANDGTHGFEPWITDGTEAGTYMIKDIGKVLGPNPSGSPSDLYAAGDLLYFILRTVSQGAELWCTDGTETGTRLVKDIFAGSASSNPGNFCADGDWLYFSAEMPDKGIELWRTLGTAESTVMIRDLVVGPDSSSPNNLIRLRPGQILFAADEGANGMELWTTDGTPAGTKLLKDIRQGNEGSHPREMALLNGEVYFTADDGEHGEELWVTDGTRDGTRILRDLVPRVNVPSQS